MKRAILAVGLAATLIATVIVANAATLQVNAGVLQTQSIVADIDVPDEPGTSTSTEDCMDGGWRTWERADGTAFPNQGQCVSYVNGGGVLYPTPSGAGP